MGDSKNDVVADHYMVRGSEIEQVEWRVEIPSATLMPAAANVAKPQRAHDDIRVGDVFRDVDSGHLRRITSIVGRACEYDFRTGPHDDSKCICVGRSIGVIENELRSGSYVRVEEQPEVQLETPPAPTFTPAVQPFPEGFAVSPPDSFGVQRIRRDDIAVGRCWASSSLGPAARRAETERGGEENIYENSRSNRVLVECDRDRKTVAVEDIDTAVAHVMAVLDKVRR